MVVLENVKHPTANSKYAEEQNTKEPFNRNLNSPRLKSAPVFVLCERCYWCATYLDTNRLLKEEGVDDDNSIICPRCDCIDCLSSLPILSNESFMFNYTVKRGIVLQFRKRSQSN
jgi:hypothetical protein